VGEAGVAEDLVQETFARVWRARGRMRRRLERFRQLAPEDQQALIDKKFAAKSPEERAHILEALR